MRGRSWIKQMFLRFLVRAKKISFPGFDGVALYSVLRFFYYSIVDGSITTRASAIAFNFFLALFPTVIFLFTLIPYIPIENFQTELFLLLQDFLPSPTFAAVEGTIQDILTQQRGGLLSLGFLFALIFSTNGFSSMMSAFDNSLHAVETRKWYEQRLIAVLLLFIMVVLITTAIALIIAGQIAINYLRDNNFINNLFNYYFLFTIKWAIVISLFFFTFSSLYFFAPSKKTRWRFISPGGTLSTLLTLITLQSFGFYIANFNKYNTLYGSIGALLVILLLLYIMSLILLIGFELNTSINVARRKIVR